MKSGKPYSAYSFDLSSYLSKWITITMTKKDSKCQTTIQNYTPQNNNNNNQKDIKDKQNQDKEFNKEELKQSFLFVSETGDCSLHSSNKIVINSRGRDGTDVLGDSFISVLDVSWVNI
mmetsp:Transcript_47873/g.61371  ORF Transcript_47873/g.61371 Transcript_47873/m.61371 type:complete len:118 (-) Transcript_47873:2-355(-)